MRSLGYIAKRSVIFSICCTFVLLVSLSGCGDQESQQAGEYKKFDLETALQGRGFMRAAMQGAPSGIMWMPDGNSFLFRKTEGERDSSTTILYKYDAATGEETKIADWNVVQEDLRKQIGERTQAAMSDVNTAARVSYTQMDLSADGTKLLGSIESDLFVFNLDSGQAKLLTNTPELEIWPSFSPDGKKIAFAKNRDLYVLTLKSGAVKRLTNRGNNTLIYNGVPDWVYDEEFALRRAFWWSPDSSKISYLQFDTSPIKTFPIVDHLETVAALEQQQYPKAGDPNSVVRLGVINVNSGSTTWVNTGKEKDSYIPRVGWLPDSSRVWLQWMNRDQSMIDLMFANPNTGATNSILQETDEAWVDVRSDAFRFVNDDYFIWASDRSGWRHLYLYKIDGILERQLTEGEWEVSNVAGMDSEKKYIYFTSTAVSPMERHIYRTAIDGSGMEKMSDDEEGTYSLDMANAGDYYISGFTSDTVFNNREIRRVTGEKLRDFYIAEVPMLKEYRLAEREYFTIKADDGTDLYAYMIKPVDFDPGKKYPVLVSIYGGPGSQAVTKRFGVNPQQQFLVQEGIIIFRLDNRGTGARGRDFLKTMHRRLGYWELKDHVTGVNYLKTLPYIDGEKVAIQGGSYGGYMTLYALLKAPETFQYGISSAPVTDWRFYDTIYTERYMDRPQDNPEGYKESAPLNFAEGLQGKLMLVHGTMDNNVHAANSIMMIEELVKAGKKFELMLYPRERHGIRTRHRSSHNNKLIIDFYFRNLLSREGEVPF